VRLNDVIVFPTLHC